MSKSSIFSLGGAIRLMLLIGLLAVLFVIMQSCQGPKSSLDRFAKGSLKKLVVLESPPLQPTLTFTNSMKETEKLSDYKGKVILLNVWATWCAPCIAEMPSLDLLNTNLGGEDFEVVTVSLDRTVFELDEFFAGNNIRSLPNLHDATYSLSGLLQLPGLPTSVFYDEYGREIARIPGEVDWQSQEALAFIDHLIDQ